MSNSQENADPENEITPPDLCGQTLERTTSSEECCPGGMGNSAGKTVHEQGAPGLHCRDQDSTVIDPSQLDGDHPDLRPSISRPTCAKTDPAGIGKRYSIEQLLGRGSWGRVFSIWDGDLERTAAVKVLEGGNGSKTGDDAFIKEARTVARLEHPNILPVYDIDVTEEGRPYFTMRKVKGRSLGDAIRASKGQSAAAHEIATPGDVVRIFLKVCDALEYAHHLGILHLDVKPDNIMLGEFGEVILLDWGSSSSGDVFAKGALVGTPAYMSPEQACRNLVDKRTDIYSLGASFFHALLRRHPAWGESPEEFWRKKSEGVFDPPTSEEKATIPQQLLGIALKAMEPQPELRYQTASEFGDDLRRYQEGLATSWRIFEEMDKGNVDPGMLHDRWIIFVSRDWFTAQPGQGEELEAWRMEDGVLAGNPVTFLTNLTFGKRIPGDMRIEWSVRTHLKAANLNCFIAGQDRFSGYTFHIGAFGTPTCCVLTKGRESNVLSQSFLDEALIVDRSYRFCMEKESNRIRLSMDGRMLFDFEDLDVLAGLGHHTFGFENHPGNRIEISSVVIHYRSLPILVSPLAIADQYFEDNLFENALVQYREIAAIYAESSIAEPAALRIGQCFDRLDRADEAEASFVAFETRYSSSRITPLAMYYRARLLYRRQRVPEAERLCREIAERYPRHPLLGTIHSEFTGKWLEAFKKLSLRAPLKAETLSFLEQGRKNLTEWAGLFSIPLQHNRFLSESTALLIRAGMPEIVLENYPEQDERCALALARLGRYSEIEGRFPHLRKECALAHLEMGRPDDVLERYSDQRSEYAKALIVTGRAKEVLENYSDLVDQVVHALVELGRSNEVLERFPDNATFCRVALTRMGCFNEILTRFPLDADQCTFALLALQRYEELLERFPNKIGAVKSAMTELGRAEEVIERFKEHDTQVTRAFLALGRVDEAIGACGSDTHARRAMYLAAGMYDQLLQEFPGFSDACCQALMALGREQELLDTYKGMRKRCAEALLQMGRFDQILEQYPDVRGQRAVALAQSGRAQEVVASYPWEAMSRAYALTTGGRYKQVLDTCPDLCGECCAALTLLGRPEESLRRYPHDNYHVPMALMELDRPHEVLDRYGRDVTMRKQCNNARYHIAAVHLSNGNIAEARTVLDLARSFRPNYSALNEGVIRLIVAPFLESLACPDRPFDIQLRVVLERNRYHYRQRPWYMAALILGQIDEAEFRSQPAKPELEGRLRLALAMKSELAGENIAAALHYCAFMNLASHDRPAETATKKLAAWRARILST